MLLKLMPEQIPEYWDDIKKGLERALPPGIPDRNARLLYGMQTGDIQVWVSFQRGLTPEDNVVDGAVVTYVLDDVAHKTKLLVIYALWSVIETKPSTWHEGFDALRKFAHAMGCTRIVAYSDNPRILELANKFGAEAKYTYLTWDI